MDLFYKELQIDIDLDGILQVESLALREGLNSHGFVSLKLLADEDTAADAVIRALNTRPVVIREKVSTGGKIIFQGQIETVRCTEENALYYLYVEAYSYTKMWDRSIKSRSFCDGDLSYLDVMQQVLKDFGKADIKDEASAGTKIPGMLLQYRESGWEFLKRLASHFGIFLAPDCTSGFGRVYFGLPRISNGVSLRREDYTLTKDFLHHSRLMRKEGILSQEATRWEIQVRRYLHMGEEVDFNGVKAVVTSVNIHTDCGELAYQYELSRRSGIRQEKIKNPYLSGMSLPATVKERNGNRIRVHFDIDPSYRTAQKLKFFTFAVESGGFYCMPEEGSRVHIYFPDGDEQNAIAVHVLSEIREEINPDEKHFSDPNGFAVEFTPDRFGITSDSEKNISITLNKSGSILVEGDDIAIQSEKAFLAGGEKAIPEIEMIGGDSVQISVGDGGGDKIILDTEVNMVSGSISHKADSMPPAVPPGAQIAAQMMAGDEAARQANNLMVASQVVAGNVASMPSLGGGLSSLGSSLGAAALGAAAGAAVPGAGRQITLGRVTSKASGKKECFQKLSRLCGLKDQTSAQSSPATVPEVSDMIQDYLGSGGVDSAKASKNLNRGGKGKISYSEFQSRNGAKANAGLEKKHPDTALSAGKADMEQARAQNVQANKKCCTFGEPIDASTGAFLITASDFVLQDIREPFCISRNYRSTNFTEGILGKGWSFPFEGRLRRDGEKLFVQLDTGHYLIYRETEEGYKAGCKGCSQFKLEKEKKETGWKILDLLNHKTYHYDEKGFLKSIGDRNGLSTLFSYAGERLKEISAPFGGRLVLDYRGGRLARIRDDLGREVQYRYHAGLLTDIIHMDRGTTHYDYDANGFLSKAFDQTGSAYVANQYDDRGRVVFQSLVCKDTYEAEYMEKERLTIIRSRRAGQTYLKVIEYDRELLPVGILYPDGTEELFEYQEGHNLTQKTDRLGRVTRYRHDKLGRIIEICYPEGLSISYKYDNQNDLRSVSDNSGSETRYLYDRRHNLIQAAQKVDKDRWRIFSYQYDSKGRMTLERDGEGNETTYVYTDVSASPSVIRYADGEEVTLEYDAAGRMMSKTDSCGEFEYGYNAGNYCTMTRDGEGRESHWMYDGMGRMLAYYPPKSWKKRSGPYRYRYDSLSRLTDTILPDGSHHRQFLDGEGNVIKSVRPGQYLEEKDDGNGILYDYDGDGNQIRVRHPDGSCERFFYDAAGNRVKHVTPEAYRGEEDGGEGYCYAYDDGDRLIKITGPDGSIEAEYSYDYAGNLISYRDEMGRTSHYRYNLCKDMVLALEPADEKEGRILYRKTSYEYDGNGNRTREQRHGGLYTREEILAVGGKDLCLTFAYDARNRLTGIEDGHGAFVRYRYDARGNIIYEEDAVSDEISQAISYAYNQAGDLIEKREELDSGLEPVPGEFHLAVTRYTYDENGNLTATDTPEGYQILREYDSCDRLVKERAVDKKNGIDRSVEISYDLNGDVVKIIVRGKDGKAREMTYEYDEKGRIIRAGDYGGAVFQFAYSNEDDSITEIYSQPWNGEPEDQNSYAARSRNRGDVEGIGDGKYEKESPAASLKTPEAGRAVQSYIYDARGRIIGIVDGRQNRTEMDLDEWGRRVAVRRADGGVETYAYNYLGQVTSAEDANGNAVTYRYNSRGLVCEIIDQEGNRETFRYDREGRMSLHIDRNGNQVRTSYNIDGKPVLETACDCNGAGKITRAWSYDTFGHLCKAVSGGFCYTYQYRPDGRLIEKTSSGKTILACTYYQDGSLRSIKDIAGKTVYYYYDRYGQLNAIKDENGREIVRYRHIPGGLLSEVIHMNGISTSYRYDADGNLICLTNRLKEEKTLSEFHFEYDLNGNRISKSGYCVGPDGQNRISEDTSYTYDENDRLIEEKDGKKSIRYTYDLCGNRIARHYVDGEEIYCYNKKNQLVSRKTGDSEVTYQYDKQGNLIEEQGKGQLRRYSYDAFNRQTGISISGINVQENFYDPEGLRAAIVENGHRTECIYYNDELQNEVSQAGDLVNRYILGYGVAARQRNGADNYASYHLDEQNNTLLIADQKGDIRNSYRYGAFGEVRGEEGTSYSRILYRGQQYDSVTGQYYLRARYYDPEAGRFQQEDEYRCDGLNLYAYCGDNPVTYYDPSGHIGSRFFAARTMLRSARATAGAVIPVQGDAPNGHVGSRFVASRTTAGAMVPVRDSRGSAFQRTQPGSLNEAVAGFGRRDYTDKSGCKNENMANTDPKPTAPKPGGETGVAVYPPRTEEAREESQKVAAALNEIRGKSNPVVCVLVHMDDTVSVGISGLSGTDRTKRVAAELEKHLNKKEKTKKYSVSATSMPTETLRQHPEGNPVGVCAEPKAVEAAHRNPSPVKGFDTIWRGKGDNPYPYTGSNPGGVSPYPNQMDPCKTCGDPHNIKEYMNYANANKQK